MSNRGHTKHLHRIIQKQRRQIAKLDRAVEILSTTIELIPGDHSDIDELMCDQCPFFTPDRPSEYGMDTFCTMWNCPESWYDWALARAGVELGGN